MDTLLSEWVTIVHDEEIPTSENAKIKKVHTPWRYFFKPDKNLMPQSRTPEDDIVTNLVMKVNTSMPGVLIFSSGKDVALFKASGWPEDVADFYRIQDYKGYIWLGHNRYPQTPRAVGWRPSIQPPELECRA